MPIKIEDYLHYHIGQPCIIDDNKEIQYVRMVDNTGLFIRIDLKEDPPGVFHPKWFKTSSCKLLLRPLSDITLDEKRTFHKVSNFIWNPHKKTFTPAEIHYLLSKGFDIFGLIKEGLAIDKTTMK